MSFNPDDLPRNHLELICLYVFASDLVKANPNYFSDQTLSALQEAQGKIYNFTTTLQEGLTVDEILNILFTNLNKSTIVH